MKDNRGIPNGNRRSPYQNHKARDLRQGVAFVVAPRGAISQTGQGRGDERGVYFETLTKLSVVGGGRR